MDENNTSPTRTNRTGLQRFILLVGSVGPLGHCPASGTVTVAVVGVPLVWLAGHYGVPLWAYLAVTAALTLGGVWIHQVGDRILGEKDSSKLVIDELVGYAVAMIAVMPTPQLLLVGFFLERGIDIVKVWPANQIEKRWPGGWGVVGDDVVAGVYTLIILHILATWVPQYVGL
ncbi:MAG: phosphatidylglycerophosphatase A [Phycisphaerae bacterium]|nr:phosphatidylglycerophosphatase A [Phycisphaerae bacterium]